MITATMQVSSYNQIDFNNSLSKYIETVGQKKFHVEIQFAIAYVEQQILHTALCIVREKEGI